MRYHFKQGDYVLWQTNSSRSEKAKGERRWVLYEYDMEVEDTTKSKREMHSGKVIYDSAEEYAPGSTRKFALVPHLWIEPFWLQKGDKGLLGMVVEYPVVVQEIIFDGSRKRLMIKVMDEEGTVTNENFHFVAETLRYEGAEV